MAGVLNDSEEQRFWVRIRCITYREIRDEMIAITGDSFITRRWISEKLRRSERWVQQHWNKTTEECYTQFGSGRPEILSQDSKDITTSASGIRGRSSRKVTREILEKTDSTCLLPTVTQETGIRDPNQEPWKTLQTFRRKPDLYGIKAQFGTYLATMENGIIRVGDRVRVLREDKNF
ncbi:unnamed protein product [Rotaria sp. Silwood1]|nr:unnamed protein product [Rotaria sp. Silwood1]